MSDALRVDLIAIGDLSDSEIRAWRELAGRAVEPNPFGEPEFVLASAATLQPRRVHLLRVADGPDWLASLPVCRTRRWRRVPSPALVAWRHPYSFLDTPLIDRERGGEAISALFGWTAAAPDTTFIVIEQLGGDGPVASLVSDHLAERGARAARPVRYERAILRRRVGEDYLDVGAKHRREWRRQRRKLESLLGAEVVTRDRAGDPDAVADFLRLEASGWKGRAGTAFASIAGHAELFARLCEGFGELGRLQLLALEAGGRRLAMKCNLVAGEAIFCFKIAFDDSLGKYSVGMQLEIDNVSWFHERTDAAWMDSCADPTNAMINRLWPDRRAIGALVVPASPLRGRLVASGVAAASALRSWRGGA
jgi:CelD/BcsL family acetyltransferase involved in cellulose biosynthesis